MTMLSAHFSLAEATRSQAASRLGISNQPNNKQLANMKMVAAKMERVRDIAEDGIIDVSSWLRVGQVNKVIGGAVTSAHLDGLAVDCTRRLWTPRKFAEKLVPYVKELEIDQLILEWDSWVHIGWTNGRPRHQIMTKNATHNYTAGLH